MHGSVCETSTLVPMPRTAMPSAKPPVQLVLFKPTDLRLHDHQPLHAAHRQAAASGIACLHVLVLDTRWFDSTCRSREAKLPRIGRLRGAFLLQSVAVLADALAARGHTLLVVRARTEAVLDTLSQTFDIRAVHMHGPEVCSEERTIEQRVASRFHVVMHWGWTLTHIDDLPSWMAGGAKAPDRYKPFLEAVQRGKGPATFREPLPEPDWVVAPVPEDLLRRAAARVGAGLPTLEALGCGNDGDGDGGGVPSGGEVAGLAALRSFVWESEDVRRYVGSSDSMSPGKRNALNSTSRLSAYLAHGCLSARKVYAEVRAFERRRVRNRSTYWVYHELVMRDFLYFSCVRWGDALFARAGPLGAHKHAWRDPSSSAEARSLFERWTLGCTGYPFVDAGMRQLRAQGTMPHLLRQLCAAFLVRDLRIDWRWGAEWFEATLLDYTPDANWGNWGYRVVPVDQLQPLATAHLTSLEILSWPIVHDPHLEYILTWLPELRAVVAEAGSSSVHGCAGAIAVREPWRLAAGYARVRSLNVAPRRDSPLWVMSVNRNNWPEYQQMMTGVAHTLRFSPLSAEVLSEATGEYPPPCVPPLELEIRYDRIPLDHSWGDGKGVVGAKGGAGKGGAQGKGKGKLGKGDGIFDGDGDGRRGGGRGSGSAQMRSPSTAARTGSEPSLGWGVQATPSTAEALAPTETAKVAAKAAPAASPAGSARCACHLYWFRKALRTHDNPSLLQARDAAVAAGVPLLCIFVLDPWFVASGRVGVNRLRFLREGLEALDVSLRSTLGVPLLVLRGGEAAEALRGFWRRFGLEDGGGVVTWEACDEDYAKARDSAVRETAARCGVEARALGGGHTLYPPEELLKLCPRREPPLKYGDFMELVEAAGPPPAPRPTVAPLPAPLLVAAHALLVASDAAYPARAVAAKTATATATATSATLEVAALLRVPVSLAEMGCNAAEEEITTKADDGKAEDGGTGGGFRLVGGEVAALERLQTVVSARPEWVRAFDKPSSNPLLWRPGSTSMLSPYLKFGMLSCRTMHAALDAALGLDGGGDSPTIRQQSLHGQLYWREFFYLLHHATPNFCRATSNPLCLQVGWRLPSTDAAAAADLRRWAEGTTGVPLVDAAMKQLRATGWLHHLLRHVVACFLTRGQLWVHWEAGRDVFDKFLLDADAAVNSANWMWLSATCFFYTYHRVYSPAHFARKYDRAGGYVRHWLPVLRRLPNEFVYEPWKAPAEVQRAAGCVVGVDYPAPMCDLERASQANLRKMDASYAAAPDSWRRHIPPAASAEVARERSVNVRPVAREPPFEPIRRAAPLQRSHSAAPPSVATVESPAPSLATATVSVLEPVEARGARGRGRGRGAGRARGSRSRIQHGLY